MGRWAAVATWPDPRLPRMVMTSRVFLNVRMVTVLSEGTVDPERIADTSEVVF